MKPRAKISSRGKNFTEKEKHRLLDLIQKYSDIIENKCTSALITCKKKETWDTLTLEFNRVSDDEPRTCKQLHTAYLNLKRTSRQNVVYQEYQNKDVEANDSDTYTPGLNNIGEQMLVVMEEDQEDHTPISNNCDSASGYYENDEDVKVYDIDVDVMPHQETNSNSIPPETPKKVINRKVQQKKKKKCNDILKEQYYKTKMECAIIEKKTKLLKYRMTKQILELEFKIKQKEYDNLPNK